MHNATHPSLIIRNEVLPEPQLSVNEAAEQLGVLRVALSRVIDGRSAITAEMALRLGKWVGNGPDFWPRMQGSITFGKPRKRANQRLRKRSGL